MFCPKCGQQNPETGKFCRSCGTDLGNVSQALASPTPSVPQPILNHKGKPISCDSAIAKIFSGIGFIAVAIALAFTVGKGWWFWLLIPAFGSLGSGIAQYMQVQSIKKERRDAQGIDPASQRDLPSAQNISHPPPQINWATSPESRYKTGDLVPPSVTDSTTRHLEFDSEGRTMTLPKK